MLAGNSEGVVDLKNQQPTPYNGTTVKKTGYF